MVSYQLDFFSENTDVCFLRRDIEELKKRSDSLRKGIFFRHNDLEKLVFELKDEINKLRSAIDQSKSQ